MPDIDIKAIRAAHPDEDTLVGALAAEVARLSARSAPAVAGPINRAGLQAILTQFFAKDGMPQHVKEWFPNEREYFREGDWDSFTDRGSVIWQMRLDRATDALLDQLAGVPDAGADTLRASLRKAARTQADWAPEQAPLLTRAAAELTRLRKPVAAPSEETRALVTELYAAALAATAWHPHQVPLLARAAAELARLNASTATHGTVTVEFTDAELVHLGSDLQADTRAKIGPRLSAALKVVTAAQELITRADLPSPEDHR